MRKRIGDFGEDLAVAYLVQKGHVILERNYRCGVGEMDIVSIYKDIYRFTEVKTAYRGAFNPLEQITHKKIMKLVKIGDWYMKHQKMSGNNWSIDALGIILTKDGKTEYFYEENITL